MNTGALLFDAGPIALVDDDEGGIRYWPQWLDPAQAEGLFARLRDGTDWHSEQRPMYDRIVDVPRLQAAIALDDADPGDALRALAARIAIVAPAAYSHVGLNFYRDGRDSVALHHDRTHDLVEGAPIAILSLGAPRDMLVRRQARGARARRIALAPGSLLVMSHASQSTHEHGIPKTAKAVGPRISCAFRAGNRRPVRRGPPPQDASPSRFDHGCPDIPRTCSRSSRKRPHGSPGARHASPPLWPSSCCGR